LSGISAAAAIALINSIGNLGGFVGPYVIGAISRRTGSLNGGLACAGTSLLCSAFLVLLLKKKGRDLVAP
jgi:ACS family tartrate transporter-like MFS transporter